MVRFTCVACGKDCNAMGQAELVEKLEDEREEYRVAAEGNAREIARLKKEVDGYRRKYLDAMYRCADADARSTRALIAASNMARTVNQCPGCDEVDQDAADDIERLKRALEEAERERDEARQIAEGLAEFIEEWPDGEPVTDLCYWLEPTENDDEGD